MNLGRAIIDIFILILFIVGVWYLYTAFETGIPIIQHIAIAIWVICTAAIFVLLAYIIKEVLQK